MTFDEWASGASSIECGGVRVATYEVGPDDAPTVTYLHGYPSASHDIAPVLAELDRLGVAIRLVTLDFPGFGASAKPADHAYSIHACADAVEATWREHGVTTTTLYSHDYGVSVGQELLARRTDGVLPVEVTAAGWSNGGIYPDLHRPTIGQELLADPEQGPPLAAQMDEALFARGIGVTWGTRAPMPPEVVHEIWESMARDDGNLRLHDLLHYMADRRQHVERWTTALERCDLPMAFVWGDLDPVSGAHMIERVERRLPDATITRLDDIGHWPPLEAPTEVATAVAGLVAR